MAKLRYPVVSESGWVSLLRYDTHQKRIYARHRRWRNTTRYRLKGFSLISTSPASQRWSHRQTLSLHCPMSKARTYSRATTNWDSRRSCLPRCLMTHSMKDALPCYGITARKQQKLMSRSSQFSMTSSIVVSQPCGYTSKSCWRLNEYTMGSGAAFIKECTIAQARVHQSLGDPFPLALASTAHAPRTNEQNDLKHKTQPTGMRGGRGWGLMIGVPTPGIYLGHSMPPTLWKSP